MRLRHLPTALLFFILFFSTPAAKGQTENTSRVIDQYLSARTEMGGFSGTVLVAKDGKIILRKGYGYADVEKRIPFTPETQHEVASISKMFTAMAALRLRHQGKLRLEDSVCKYLSDCPDIWKPITVQQLMRHTSGIADYEEALDLGSEKYMQFMTQSDASAKIFENAKKLPLDFKPGEKFHYSNTGYIVLGHVIQRAAGQPFAEFVTNNILKPVGMTHSGVLGWRSSPKRLANGYTHGDLGWEKSLAGVPLINGHLKRVPRLPLTPPEGDAWLYSTVDDLYRWSQLMDGSGFVATAEVAEVFTPGLDNYGYGWFIGNAFNRKRMNHTGALPGYVSNFIKFPDDKITIIIFSNLDRARTGSISRDVTAIVMGAPFDMPVRGQVVKLSLEQLSRLEGVYKMADGKLLTISNAPDFLTAELKGRYTAGLIPLSPTEFYFPLGDGRAIFTLDAKGQATKVNMRYGGEDHIAERMPQQP
ncbi:MAG TPA: serine hydrolase domain-containing protein [Pyrinomonadaceae bacterium]|jgi:CubicO group peptidase (beta-lactamase class C family)|nr:serine hydrolase domain-containing protein [Pyrinomonadaceae bacterium]